LSIGSGIGLGSGKEQEIAWPSSRRRGYSLRSLLLRFNGNEKITSTIVRFDKNTIVFTYPEYGSRLEVVSAHDALEGSYFLANGAVYEFEARRFKPASSAGDVPSIGGQWTIEVPTTKDERAWHLIINQSGPEVSASILRVDGDSGAVTGAYDGSKFVLGHFSGARPLRLELLPQAAGFAGAATGPYHTRLKAR
jgi:hypothetical protein